MGNQRSAREQAVAILSPPPIPTARQGRVKPFFFPASTQQSRQQQHPFGQFQTSARGQKGHHNPVLGRQCTGFAVRSPDTVATQSNHASQPDDFSDLKANPHSS